MKRARITCWIVMATVGFLAAADAPYIGKWKLNPDKSQLTGETVSIEKNAKGGMTYTTAETKYDFMPDGKEHPVPGGRTAAWTETSPDNWEVTIRTKGKLTATVMLAVKGDSMTTMTHRPKPDGGMMMDSSTLTRVSGGPGILGKWKSTEVKATAATMELAANGADGVTLKVPEYGIACTAKFDGKDYAMTGPQAPSKDTLSFKKIGPNLFEMTEKIAGKAVYVDTFTVSPDGKTLTDDGTPISTQELTKAVYDRQ